MEPKGGKAMGRWEGENRADPGFNFEGEIGTTLGTVDDS